MKSDGINSDGAGLSRAARRRSKRDAEASGEADNDAGGQPRPFRRNRPISARACVEPLDRIPDTLIKALLLKVEIGSVRMVQPDFITL